MDHVELDAPKYIVSHSRGYLNIDDQWIHFTSDGNWGNINMAQVELNETARWKRMKELTKERSRTIGMTLGIIALALYIVAATMYSLLILFFAVASTYLCWASLRQEEISGVSLPIVSLKRVEHLDQKTVLTFSLTSEEPLLLILRKVSAPDEQRLRENLELKKHG